MRPLRLRLTKTSEKGIFGSVSKSWKTALALLKPLWLIEMKATFRTANWKSIGFVSTVAMTIFLAGLMYYVSYNVYRNVGTTTLFFVLFAFASLVPIIWIIHSISIVEISHDIVTKKSIFKTKSYKLSDFRTIYITDTVVSNVPSVEIIDKDKAKHEKWCNFFTVRQIVLCKEDTFNPLSFRNRKKILTLPYYDKLYEGIKDKITTNHNKK